MYALISRNNQFLNQDINPTDNEVQKLTGFTGSNATLLLGKDNSYLFTDSRYEIQAKLEVPQNVEVVIGDFSKFAKNFKEKIFYNPWCHSITEVENFPKNMCPKAFEPKYNKNAKVFEYPIEFAGVSEEEKLAMVQKYLKEKNLEAMLVCKADNVSWLLNLRSDNLPNSPVYLAFAIVPAVGNVKIFKNKSDLKAYKNIGVHAPSTPQIFATWLKKKCVKIDDFISELKANKNPIELKESKKAHIKDGVAITKLLHWLSENWQGKTELDVVEKLHQLRLEQKDFWGESFETISAMNEHGVIVHYRPSPETNKKLENGLLLIDSGAQYLGGTTDVTRTIALGKIIPEMKKHFTLVLKAHIGLTTAIFPKDCLGSSLDSLARTYLWKEGLDYRHGTGHGVGAFLNVHEAPVAVFSAKAQTKMFANMVVSIEPGLYLENKYGIRIENLVKIISKGDFLAFEALTCVPLDKSLVDDYLLSDDEKNWLNHYQKEVYKKLEKHLNDKEKNWLNSYMFGTSFTCQC